MTRVRLVSTGNFSLDLIRQFRVPPGGTTLSDDRHWTRDSVTKSLSLVVTLRLRLNPGYTKGAKENDVTTWSSLRFQQDVEEYLTLD